MSNKKNKIQLKNQDGQIISITKEHFEALQLIDNLTKKIDLLEEKIKMDNVINNLHERIIKLENNLVR